jgi:hypothetical protein
VGFEVRKQGEKGWHHVLDRTIGRCKDLGSWIVVDPVFVKKKRFERELGLDNLGHQTEWQTGCAISRYTAAAAAAATTRMLGRIQMKRRQSH